MAARQGRGPDGPQRFLPLFLVAASLLSLVISTRSLLGMPERIGLTVIGVFERGFSAVGNFVGDTALSIRSLQRLRGDYEALLEKTKDMEKLQRDFAGLEAENDRLRGQLGFAQTLVLPEVAARVIGKDPGNLYSTITIDKGIESGIRKNMPVIAWQDGVRGLVGRVIESGQGTSVIVPLFNSSSFVAARLAKSRFEGLLSGKGSEDEVLDMAYVSKRALDDTQPGDLVISSGLDSLYPPDLALGRVKRIDQPEYQTSLDIEVEPILDFSRIEYVFVLETGDSTQAAASAATSLSAAGAAAGGTP
ncbi:MAG TPA: rod shape-determining protein MreC [Rectinemataceae bacterium]|nr:rod shape-determining protein MreC [Rectinemataceae bacterium]